jgi:hypothetical protein
MKTSAKQTGKRTRMKAETFEADTVKRYVEDLVVERAYLGHPSWKLEPTSVAQGVEEVKKLIMTVGQDNFSLVLMPAGRKMQSCPSVLVYLVY